MSSNIGITGQKVVCLEESSPQFSVFSVDGMKTPHITFKHRITVTSRPFEPSMFIQHWSRLRGQLASGCTLLKSGCHSSLRKTMGAKLCLVHESWRRIALGVAG